VRQPTPQLPLRLRFPLPRRFDAFVVGDNAAAIAAITRLAHGERADNLFLSGIEGSGKSHLLGAAVADTPGAVYLPLAELGEHAEPMIAATQPAPLICVDDVDALAGRRGAEIALFDLFNRVREGRGRIAFAARSTPSRLGIALPDLVSRLASLAQIQLRPLDDAAAREVVLARARQRGFDLDEDVLEFLFRRFVRNLGPMLALIDQIDLQSLAERRRITVPFVRSVVERQP
jgi:DnaA family protein